MTIIDLSITFFILSVLYVKINEVYRDYLKTSDLSLRESESIYQKYVDLELTKRYINKKGRYR